VKTVRLAVAALFLGACAQSYQPIVDRQGVDPAQYQADLAECRTYAEQVNPVGEAVAGAFLGALLGAAVGAATGAVVGQPKLGATYGAAAAGTAGTAAGAAGGIEGQIRVIRTCLAGRGYRVLR